MIQNSPYINSKDLIAEIYSDYHIESDDFITRFATWCLQCLEDLNIVQAYVNITKEFEFDNHKLMLPYGLKGINSVIINNEKASLFPSNKFNKDAFKKGIGIEARTPYICKSPSNIRSITSRIEQNNDNAVYYYIENNWLHTNKAHGKLILDYQSLPVVYDSDTNMYFPLIYDNELLREAIKLYVMRHILMRGYIHPVLNLRDNNPYTNPGLAYDRMRFRVRTSCNKFNIDRRENIASILSSMF